MAEYFETRLGRRYNFWHQCPCLGANCGEEGLAGGCRPHIGHREVLLVSFGLWGHLLWGWVQFLIVKTSQEGLSWYSVFQHLSGHPEPLSSALPSLVLTKEMENLKTITVQTELYPTSHISLAVWTADCVLWFRRSLYINPLTQIFVCNINVWWYSPSFLFASKLSNCNYSCRRHSYKQMP